MSDEKIITLNQASSDEQSRRAQFIQQFQNAPIPENEMLSNLGLFIRRQDLSRILFMNELYQLSLDIHGVVMEFGVRWGQNLALFESFRGIYEPFNHRRKIVGFDTWEGFPSVHEKDGANEAVKQGSHSVTEGYEGYLESVLAYHESEAPIPHVRKFELCKGDVMETLPKYLKDNPETIVSLAYFDLDIYEPTKKCLEAIRPHLTRGSVIGFDQLLHPGFPGETVALREALGLENVSIRRSPISSAQSYIVVGD